MECTETVRKQIAEEKAKSKKRCGWCNEGILDTYYIYKKKYFCKKSCLLNSLVLEKTIEFVS